ncbi:MAG: alpha/beta hydrolase [Cycloclasticus sp.]|jgi:2-hydroxymuconate-semialdehyde hydrolase|nr:alpha/beta hydrolase [Cycloclasticus sp.]MEE4290272.1 alpha/beta hydrolase [Cycloclasticus sp.]
MQTSNIQTGSFQTFLNETGIENDTCILLLHGSGPGANAMSNWHYALPFLAENYHCLAPDIAGFGLSQHDSPPNGTSQWIDVWVQQQIDLLDAKGIEQAHIVGNSMGGGVTLHLLNRHPERFKKAVLMGPVGAPFEPTDGLTKGWEFYKDPSKETLEYLITKFLFDPSLLGDDIASIAAQRFDNVMKDEVRVQFEAMFSGGTKKGIDAFVLSDEELNNIPHQMLVTHAREDFFIPLNNAYHLIERIPKAQLHVFDHCGHWIQIEKKKAFNNLTKLFFDGAFDD